MAIQSDIISAVLQATSQNSQKIDACLDHLQGGWEGWLQVEAAVSLIGQKINVQREYAYSQAVNTVCNNANAWNTAIGGAAHQFQTIWSPTYQSPAQTANFQQTIATKLNWNAQHPPKIDLWGIPQHGAFVGLELKVQNHPNQMIDDFERFIVDMNKIFALNLVIKSYGQATPILAALLYIHRASQGFENLLATVNMGGLRYGQPQYNNTTRTWSIGNGQLAPNQPYIVTFFAP